MNRMEDYMDADLFLSRSFHDHKFIEKENMVGVWTTSGDLFFASDIDPADELEFTPELSFEDLLKFTPLTEHSIRSNDDETELLPRSMAYDQLCEPSLEDSPNQLLSSDTTESVEWSHSTIVGEDPAEVVPASRDVFSFQLGDLKVRTVKLVRDEAEAEHSYLPLNLTDEERRMLDKEGISLPSHYPLTKQEERDFKRIRRKIRNKISAQDSRKRKRVYVDTLEERVKECNEENHSLKKRLLSLEAENSTLMAQLRHLKTLLVKKAKQANSIRRDGGSTAQPATCLLVLLLSFGLFMAPNVKSDLMGKPLSMEKNPPINNIEKFSPFAGRSRSLLQQFALEDLQLDSSEKTLNVEANTSSVDVDQNTDWLDLGKLLPNNNNFSLVDIILKNADVAESVKNGQNKAPPLVEDL